MWEWPGERKAKDRGRLLVAHCVVFLPSLASLLHLAALAYPEQPCRSRDPLPVDR